MSTDRNIQSKSKILNVLILIVFPVPISLWRRELPQMIFSLMTFWVVTSFKPCDGFEAGHDFIEKLYRGVLASRSLGVGTAL